MNNDDAHQHSDRQPSLTAGTVSRAYSIRPLQVTLFAVIGIILALLGLRISLYPAVLSAPHGAGSGGMSISALAILTVLYLVAGVGIFRVLSTPNRRMALWRSTWWGAIIGGGVLGAFLSDTLLGASSAISAWAWYAVMLAAPLGWAMVSFNTTRSSGAWRYGIVAAIWSGMVSVLIAAVGELASTLLILPRLVQNELGNPDYLAWHQPDVQGYAIASVISLNAMGLLLVPVAASVLASIGSWLARSTASQPKTIAHEH